MSLELLGAQEGEATAAANGQTDAVGRGAVQAERGLTGRGGVAEHAGEAGGRGGEGAEGQ